MNSENFDALVDKLFDECKGLLAVKSKEYTKDSDDRLHNFKVAARIDDETPEKALWGMYKKHLVSVMDLIKTDNLSVDFHEKIRDSINYHTLLLAIFTERRNAARRKKT